MADRQKPSRLKEGLTKRFTSFYHSPITGEGTVSTNSGTHHVYWFSGGSSAIGQATPFGTIVLNKARLDTLSETARKVVVEHEVGHTIRRPEFRGAYWGMFLWMLMGVVFLYEQAIALLQNPGSFEIQSLIGSTAVVVILVGGFVVANKLEEIAADLHALKHVSEEDYLATWHEIVEQRDPSFMWRIVSPLMYTQPETIVRLHRLRQRLQSRL